MQAARYYGAGDVRVEEVNPRATGPNEVRIEVAACGICGSDLHEYADGPRGIPEEPHPVTGESVPITIGHELSGTVVEAGEEVENLSPGTDVVVNPIVWCGSCQYCDAGHYNRCEAGGFVGISGGGGGFSEELVVSAEKAVPIPDSVPVELAALAEPFTVGLHAINQSAFTTGDTVAVFGAGPIGLTTIQQLRAAGAGRIYVSEPQTARRERAGEHGADELIDPLEQDPVERIIDETGGVDVAYEVAGIEVTVNQAIDVTKTGGDVTIISLFEDEVSIDPTAVVTRERTITGSSAFRGGPRSAEDLSVTLRRFATGELDPEPLVTSRLDLENIDEGFQRLLDDGSDEIKVLIRP